jgi:mono/diheme cytochrome c family protein
LILRQDKSVVSGLKNMARTSNNLVGRFHALWTLEGLGALDAATVRAQMKDANPRMRIQAIRASESLYKAGDRSFDADYRAAATDKDTTVAIQAMLTLNYLKAPNVAEAVRAAQAANPARGVQEIGNQILKPAASAFGRGGRGGPPPFSPAELAVMERGEAIYKEGCFACHGDDGRGTAQPGAAPGITMAPSLAASARVQGHRDYVIKTLLHGMDGPIDGKSYAAGVMAPVGSNKDEWVAAIASYVRNTFGNVGTFVTESDVARVRAATSGRKAFWKVDELVASLPTPIEVLPTWKASASHNPGQALGALSFASWTTGTPQQPGMWFQVELPETTTITELQFNAQGGGFGGGGRGRGGAPGQPAPPPPVGPYPIGYKLEVSTDGSSWKEVAAGAGTAGSTAIAFAPVQARFLRLTQTGSAENAGPWSMQRLRLYRPGTGGGAR